MDIEDDEMAWEGGRAAAFRDAAKMTEHMAVDYRRRAEECADAVEKAALTRAAEALEELAGELNSWAA